MERLRLQYLRRQLSALAARVRMLKGERLTFDEESRALYDAVAPTLPESHFQAILDRLDRRFPGQGPLVERYDAFRGDYVIPKEKLDAVFQKAIAACRERTLAHVTLPQEERFTVEYVTNKSWSGYNWYQGVPKPDPSQHRPADLRRSRDRPRLPGIRGITSTTRCSRSTW